MAVELTGSITNATSEEAAYAKTNARLDNIIADGQQTQGNTELVDIRTGADNVIYQTAGTAVRSQFTNLSERFVTLSNSIDSVQHDMSTNFVTLSDSVDSIRHDMSTINAVREQISILENSKADASLFAIVIEPTTVTTHPVCEIGSISGSTGQNTENATRIRNDTLILLNEGDSIDFANAYSAALNTNRIAGAVIFHYNTDRTFINSQQLSFGISLKYTATQTEYIRFVCAKSSGDVTSEWAVATAERIDVEKNQNVQTLDINAMLDNADTDAFVEGITRNKTKTWYAGKKFAFLGDSITHLDTFSYLRNNFVPDSVTDCGISGSTICGNGANAMWQDTRINSLPLDADVIHVMGGTNDNVQNKPIGEISLNNYNTNTFVGAYNVLLSKIYYKYFRGTTGKYSQTIDYSNITRINADRYSGFPYIMIATPFYSIQAQENESKYADAIKEIAKMWHIPCVDHYYLDGINDQNAYRYQDDDIHPNARGRSKMYGTLQGVLMDIEPPELS